ncbi:helix-turn-helix domain-containing protein [Halococcus agarilyticus]|uniref:hypothetical protein n=1 Tax=Halococcus agarilyticus TaxID=1232219 RepID=UPI000677C0C3|nr:hypothetical protein [Halococcus agarilyticus]
MAALPDWIDSRIDRNLDNSLTQRHVVATMLDAERPFFSARQVQSRVKPDISKATVRNRLNELRELDIVATEAYPESETLYYIDYPESNWPLSPEGQRALTMESPLDRLSMRGFLTMQETAGIRTLVLAGYQLTLLLLALGAVLSVLGLDVVFGSGIPLWGTAFNVLAVSTLTLVTERAVSWVRSRYGRLNPLPSA